MRLKTLFCLCLGLLLSGGALADNKSDDAAVKSGLENKFPDLKLDSLKKLPYGDLYEGVVEGDQIFYTDKNASFLLIGNLIDAKSKNNLTEEKSRDLMRTKFNAFPFDLAIKQVKGNGKRKMVVFSDPDCPYCRRLEAELAQITDVTIYTFLYPIPSLHPEAEEKVKAVWCAPDRTKAWEDLIQKGIVPKTGSKCNNPVAKLNELGRKLNINGTPAMIFSNGVKIPGMVSAANLEKLLNGERPQR